MTPAPNILLCAFSLRSSIQKYLLLLEVAGVLGEPRPHRPALDDRELSPRFFALLRRFHDRLLSPSRGLVGEQFLETMIGAKQSTASTRHEALRQILEPVSAKDLEQLLASITAIHRRLISDQDRRDGRRLLREAARLFKSERSRIAQAQLSDFIHCPERSNPIRVIPYMLSADCNITIGCALEDLVVLGVHPKSSATQILGVLIHEAIHIALDQLPVWSELNEPTAQILGEALATALGTVWFVDQLTGTARVSAWYDDSVIESAAKLLYPRLAETLSAGARLNSILPMLTGQLGLR